MYNINKAKDNTKRFYELVDVDEAVKNMISMIDERIEDASKNGKNYVKVEHNEIEAKVNPHDASVLEEQIVANTYIVKKTIEETYKAVGYKINIEFNILYDDKHRPIGKAEEFTINW